MRFLLDLCPVPLLTPYPAPWEPLEELEVLTPTLVNPYRGEPRWMFSLSHAAGGGAHGYQVSWEVDRLDLLLQASTSETATTEDLWEFLDRVGWSPDVAGEVTVKRSWASQVPGLLLCPLPETDAPLARPLGPLASWLENATRCQVTIRLQGDLFVCA